MPRIVLSNEDKVVLFWSLVDRSGGPDACWEWQGPRYESGYGKFYYDGDSYAYRIAYRLSNRLGRGEIPRGTCVMHSCDNRPCCNPGHLSLGTHLENMRDKHLRGRDSRCGPYKKDGSPGNLGKRRK